MDSPCIKQCKLVNDICTGCSRTKEEITNWTRYTDEQRSKIMSWIFISYENSDQEHIREITSFDTEKEAAKYRVEDLEFYGYGSYEIYEVDDKED